LGRPKSFPLRVTTDIPLLISHCSDDPEFCPETRTAQTGMACAAVFLSIFSEYQTEGVNPPCFDSLYFPANQSLKRRRSVLGS
jgi:hypothetical protein